MIQNKKDLCFYIAADRIMNGLPWNRGIKESLKNLIDRPVCEGGLSATYVL